MKKKVAVVEDNPDNPVLLQVLLEERYDIVEYENGFDAVTGLLQEQPDLLLLDVSLPGMDGLEVLQRLRSDPRYNGLPIIALTAHAMIGDREKFLQLGFDDYVTKPILDENLLFRAIERGLRGKE